MFTQVIVADNQ